VRGQPAAFSVKSAAALRSVDDQLEKPERGAWTACEIALVFGVGLAFSIGVIRQWEPLNGMPSMSKWEWPWRDLGVLDTAVLLVAPFAAIAWVVWKSDASSRRSARWLVALLVFANFCLQVQGILADPRGIDLVAKIVASPTTTSYFSDALLIRDLGDWLREFPRGVRYLHSVTHPAGPVLFYYLLLKWVGSLAPLLGGLLVGLVGSLGIAVVYVFAGLWTEDVEPRLLAAAFYALNPALILFFPEFDQGYPIFAMLLILFWIKAVRVSLRYAYAFGAVLFATTFFAYNTLAIGAFLVYYTLDWLWRHRGGRAQWRVLIRATAISLATFGGLYVLLWMATGYDPVRSFERALVKQRYVAEVLARPYWKCAVADPLDFLLAAGVIALPILILHLRRTWIEKPASLVLTLSGLATILTVALSGLLRAETARLWLFLQPLLVVPVALELSGLDRRWRIALFALQWWIVVCLKAKMVFVDA